MAKVKLLIKGHVQGVFYRHSAKEKADSLGLKGWIRNVENGMVEAEVCGEKNMIKELVTWCRRGPERAHVEEVETFWQDEESDGPESNHNRFEIR